MHYGNHDDARERGLGGFREYVHCAGDDVYVRAHVPDGFRGYERCEGCDDGEHEHAEQELQLLRQQKCQLAQVQAQRKLFDEQYNQP